MFIYIAFAFLLIFLYFKRLYSYWERRGFPYIPAKFPLGSVGSVGFKEHSCVFFKRHYDNFKDKAPAFGVFFFTLTSVAITDLELIKDVFVRHFESFHERGFYINEQADPLSSHLFALGGQKWKELRAKLTPTFTSGRMKMMFPLVLKAADRMVDYIKPLRTEQFEVREVFAQFTTEVIASVALGIEIECLGNPNSEFRNVAKTLFEPTGFENFRMIFIFAFPTLAKLFNMRLVPKKSADFFMSVIRDALEHRESNKVERNDFLQLLINIKNSEEGMTFNEIAANSFIFFSAGFETSSSVMTFATYELALNQDIQERLRQEITEVLARHNGEVTYEAIMEMKYLDMVFNETLRKYPVVDLQIRKSVKDYAIPNTDLVIPAGSGIMVPVYAIHHDEKYYENPEKFDPERFTEENVKRREPYSYLPFSLGPRQCIGIRFGTMQTKVGLVSILRKFRIKTSSKTLIPMKYNPRSGFMSPLGGMFLKFEEL